MPASDDETLELDRQLCFALYRAQRAMTRAYAPLLEPLGLTYPQYLVMLVLWRDDDLPVNQLGERLGLDSGTLTPLCKRLEAEGKLVRRRDRDDERIVRIRLTAAGRALEVRARKIPAAIACAGGFDLDSARARNRLVALRDELATLGDRLSS